MSAMFPKGGTDRPAGEGKYFVWALRISIIDGLLDQAVTGRRHRSHLEKDLMLAARTFTIQCIAGNLMMEHLDSKDLAAECS